MIRDVASPESRIVDVGGGSSPLSAWLIGEGFRDVTVIDLSATGLARGKERAGPSAKHVRWIQGDVTRGIPLGAVDVWHDRAVFHFLTDAWSRAQYRRLCSRSVSPGGHAIIATFAPDGPETCSGLPVQRYDARRLAKEFAPEFALRSARREVHRTPWGSTQSFQYVDLQRRRPIRRASKTTVSPTSRRPPRPVRRSAA